MSAKQVTRARVECGIYPRSVGLHLFRWTAYDRFMAIRPSRYGAIRCYAALFDGGAT